MDVESLSRRWLEQEKVFPTRSLELAMARAFTLSPSPNAALIASAALENDPVAASEHVDLVRSLQTSAFLQRAPEENNLDKQRSAGSTLPFFSMQLAERDRLLGVHRDGVSSQEDYRPSPIEEWATQVGAGSRRIEDVHLIGPSDYLRLTSWSIDLHFSHGSHRFKHSRYGGGFEELLRNKHFGHKQLVKSLKKASGSLLPSELATGLHQDLLMMNGPSGVIVRPASFLAEGRLLPAFGETADEVLAQSLGFGPSPSAGIRDGILELEELLNSTKSVENDFQKLFERHPALLLGTDYERLVSQPVLVREDEANLIPDFVMVPYSDAAPKIVDLKRPDVSIYRSDKNREGFLSPLIQARDQLAEYRDYFNSRESSRRTLSKIGTDLYLPRIAVVIGRSSSFPSTFARRKAESRVSDLEVITYDDVLSRARRLSGFA